MVEEAFGRLTSRDPDRFWTSGQWMTERRGGSDVGQSPPVSVWAVAIGERPAVDSDWMKIKKNTLSFVGGCIFF